MPLFTRVRRETVWKSGIGPEWGSESGQEEWKESPFGCILSPQRRAPDALGYFPNSFGRGILRSSLPEVATWHSQTGTGYAAPRTGRIGSDDAQRLIVASSSSRASLCGLRIA